MRIYVASSWRNEYQAEVVETLRAAGHEVYDFKNPAPDDHGFHWSEIDVAWQTWTVLQFVDGLRHQLADEGFSKDFGAMQWADACVLVLPCGRSAHLEAGYFVGASKPLLILVDQIEPELMYKMADSVHGEIGDVLQRLEVLEDAMPAIGGSYRPDGQPDPVV